MNIVAKASRSFFYRVVALTGMPLVDYRTGKRICRVWVIPWRGKLRIFGIPDYLPVRLDLEAPPQGWLQSTVLVASLVPEPDYPSLHRDHLTVFEHRL